MEKEGEIMHNYGSVNPSDLATLSLFNNSQNYRRGDDVLISAAHADGTAVGSKLNSLERGLSDHSDRMSELLRDRQFNDIQLAVSGVREELARVAGDNRVELQHVLRELQKTHCDISKQISDCCCEMQKETISQGNQTRELINQRALDDAHRALDRADRDNHTAQLIAAFTGSQGHHHHRT